MKGGRQHTHLELSRKRLNFKYHGRITTKGKCKVSKCTLDVPVSAESTKQMQDAAMKEDNVEVHTYLSSICTNFMTLDSCNRERLWSTRIPQMTGCDNCHQGK